MIDTQGRTDETDEEIVAAMAEHVRAGHLIIMNTNAIHPVGQVFEWLGCPFRVVRESDAEEYVRESSPRWQLLRAPYFYVIEVVD